MTTDVWRQLAVAACLIAQIGCTTMRPIERVSAASIAAGVDVGDEVRVVTTSGNSYDLEITQVSGEALHGTTSAGKRYRVPFTIIASIEVAEVSGAKIGGGVLLGLLAIIGLGWYAIDEINDEEGN